MHLLLDRRRWNYVFGCACSLSVILAVCLLFRCYCVCVDTQMLVGIMDDIQRHYVDSKPDSERLWLEGQIAISQFSDDGLFYRARVLNVIDADTVEVRWSPRRILLWLLQMHERQTIAIDDPHICQSACFISLWGLWH